MKACITWSRFFPRDALRTAQHLQRGPAPVQHRLVHGALVRLADRTEHESPGVVPEQRLKKKRRPCLSHNRAGHGLKQILIKTQISLGLRAEKLYRGRLQMIYTGLVQKRVPGFITKRQLGAERHEAVHLTG